MIKKIVLFTVAILLCLIPTYILIFQLAKTNPATLILGEETIEPAYVRWIVIDGDGNEVVTSRSEEKAEKDFEKQTPLSLTVEELWQLEFTKAPTRSAVALYRPLEAGGYENYATMTWEEFLSYEGEISPRTQLVLITEIRVSEYVTVLAAYSFEVTNE